MAKARASLASVGTANWLDGKTAIFEYGSGEDEGTIYRTPTGEEWDAPALLGGASSAVSWAIRRGLFAPPPETISWWIFVFGRTKRFRASTMERAVKIVTVRIKSFGFTWRRRPRVRVFFA
jgi:hypothetical protein